MTTRDAAILLPCPFCGKDPAYRQGVRFSDAQQIERVAYCESEACPIRRTAMTAAEWNTRSTNDLARLLEAMCRDAADEKYGCHLRIRVWAEGSGTVTLDRGETATFDTIEAGVAQLKAIIDDAEEG